MPTKERSPNFPQISLSKAIELISKIYGEARRTPVKTIIGLKALGYNSLNGRSKGVLAALKAYGLLRVTDDVVQVSDLALRILVPKSDVDSNAAKMDAFLNPKLFNSIYVTKGDLSEKMLTSELFHSGFTHEGALKAVQIYQENRAFINADKIEDNENINLYNDQEEDELEEVDIDEKPPAKNDFSKNTKTPLSSGALTNIEHMLAIPLDIGNAYIPRGMSEDDFSLLQDSLNLWKRKIVKSA